MVELELEPAGVLPALAIGDELEAHAESLHQDLEQVGAGAALAALDPRQVGHRGIRTRQLRLGEPLCDPRRLDPGAEKHRVDDGQVAREFGAHEHILPRIAPNLRQVTRIWGRE